MPQYLKKTGGGVKIQKENQSDKDSKKQSRKLAFKESSLCSGNYSKMTRIELEKSLHEKGNFKMKYLFHLKINIKFIFLISFLTLRYCDLKFEGKETDYGHQNHETRRTAHHQREKKPIADAQTQKVL